MSGATCPQLRRLAFAWVMLPCRDRPTRDVPCGARVALMANFPPRIAMSWWTAAEFAQCGGPGRDSALHLAEGVPINRTPSRAGRAPRRCRRLLDRPSPIPRAECDQSGADPVESARHLEVDTGDTGGHMSPLDIARSIPIATDADFDRWLGAHGATEREVVIAIYKEASGSRPSNSLRCRRSRYARAGSTRRPGESMTSAMRSGLFPRRPGSNWSPGNREAALRLLAAGRVRPPGAATLPRDL